MMELEFDFSSMMAGFVFGVVGLWLIRQAKVQAKFSLGFIGLAMMIYPYFVSGPLANWGIGVALSYLAYREWNS